MNDFKIYGLSDPRNPNEIRYIGQTKRTLAHRLNQHIQRAKYSGETNYRCCWVRSLLDINLKPVIVLIENNISEDLINIKEIELIQKYRNLGFNLTNTTDGGNCCSLTEETIQKIVNKNTRIKISKEELYNMYVVNEMTQKEIAEKYNCYESTIAHKREKYGISSRNGYPKHIKDKMSKLKLGTKQSEEHRKHNAESVKRRYKPLLLKKELENLLLTHKNINQISKTSNIDRRRIKRMFNYYKITTNKTN